MNQKSEGHLTDLNRLMTWMRVCCYKDDLASKDDRDYLKVIYAYVIPKFFYSNNALGFSFI